MSVEKLCGKTLSNAHPKPFKWQIEKKKWRSTQVVEGAPLLRE